ncbi:MAG: ATP citrate lyase citrate-binding domain-containing protein [Patescibacteria group bacterium]
MSRKKISEYRAKLIVNKLLDMPYQGWAMDSNVEKKEDFGATELFVVKVDQAIKQRFKRGLIFINVSKVDLTTKCRELIDKGYRYLLIEPYFPHSIKEERYLSFRREKDGVVFSYSRDGGVDIEQNLGTVQSDYFEKFEIGQLSKNTGLSIKQLELLRMAFDDLYMSMLEINPYVASGGKVNVLDIAIEVDSAAGTIAHDWDEGDIRMPATSLTNEEIIVKQLEKDSRASFSLEVINPNGSIFLLLSGGGASVVIADEIFILGKGKELANYGEYSGNPNEEETKIYAEQVIRLLLKSNAPKKVLFIGGAVANFTDIASTLSGIASALEKYRKELFDQGVKIYVRRGGPNQNVGLELMRNTLKEIGLLGDVYGPSESIPEVVQKLLKGTEQ